MNPYALSIVLFGILLPATSTFSGDVIVNGVALDQSTKQGLERGYGVPIKPGRYWYDAVSGVWGMEGEPGAGQIQPGQKLGGPIRRDAPKGNTGVVVNGRELHEQDVAALQRCLAVVPGQYWVLATGSAARKAARPNSILRLSAVPNQAEGRVRNARTTATDNSTAATSAQESA